MTSPVHDRLHRPKRRYSSGAEEKKKVEKCRAKDEFALRISAVWCGECEVIRRICNFRLHLGHFECEIETAPKEMRETKSIPWCLAMEREKKCEQHFTHKHRQRERERETRRTQPTTKSFFNCQIYTPQLAVIWWSLMWLFGKGVVHAYFSVMFGTARRICWASKHADMF